MTLRIQSDRLLAGLHELARITDCPGTGDASLPDPQDAVTRIVFTPRDLEARQWLRQRVDQAGFLWREDAVGNTFIRWPGSAPELAAVATGSHIDAIPYAGMYDGTVGVLGGLEAMLALREAGFEPLRPIELVLFTSEEPTRFGLGCLGSRLLGGALHPSAADALRDRLHESEPDATPGGTLRDARMAAGIGGDLATVPLSPGTYAAFLELHIEQGPLLEREGIAVGVVTAIAGPASYRITVEGLGGHAGALLMPERRDALCAASELVLGVERLVRTQNEQAGQEQTVGTVGKLEIHPGAVNSVPSRVTCMLDLRSTDLSSRTAVIHHLRALAGELEQRRGVRIRLETLNENPVTQCDSRLVAALENAARDAGISSRRMISRAYHDTSFMSLKTPVAMLFIPCRNGVSHRPDEYATPEAICRGTEVLARTLAALASNLSGPAAEAHPGQID